MNIINREFINKNIKFYDSLDTDDFYQIQDFYDAINFWKMILWEGYGLRPGNIVSFFDSSIRFKYVTLFFAAAELGLTMLTPPEKPTDSTGRTTKLDVMIGKGKIDLCITDDIVAKTAPEILAMANYYSKVVLPMDIYDTYKIKNDSTYQIISNMQLGNTFDTLLLTTSSGTTAEPKFLSYTHSQLCTIGKRNFKVFDFENANICHTRNMHHAYVLMVNFLPTLYGCKNHYTYVPPDRSNATPDKFYFINFIIKNKISKLTLSHKDILDELLDTMIAHDLMFTHKIDIIVGGFWITPDYVSKIEKVNINSIISNFGSNETLGPITLRYVTQDTPIENYKINYLGCTVDNFYATSLVDNQLHVTCFDLFPDIKVMGDKITGSAETGFYHLGREHFYRINDIDFDLNIIEKIVSKYTDKNITITLDMPYQKLYLSVWADPLQTIDLQSINEELQQKYGALNIVAYSALDRKNFESFKLDHDQIREYFRKKLNLS